MTPLPPSPAPSPAPRDPERARALADARRSELLRRARRIRRSVAAMATSLFVAAFLVVYVQLASGHDPALVASKARRANADDTALVGESSSSKSTETSSGETGSSTSSVNTSQS